MKSRHVCTSIECVIFKNNTWYTLLKRLFYIYDNNLDFLIIVHWMSYDFDPNYVMILSGMDRHYGTSLYI